MAADSVRCPPDRGECVKGGYPLSQESNDESELAEARLRAGEFRFAARSAGLDSVQRQLTLIWTLLILLLGTFLGTLTTVLPRG